MALPVTTGRKFMGRLAKGNDLLAALGKYCLNPGIGPGELARNWCRVEGPVWASAV